MISILIVSILSSFALWTLLRMIDGKHPEQRAGLELDRAAIREQETGTLGFGKRSAN